MTYQKLFAWITWSLAITLICFPGLPAQAERSVQSEFIPMVPPGNDAPNPMPRPPAHPQTPAGATANYKFHPISPSLRLTGGGQAGYLEACGTVQFGESCYPRGPAYKVTPEFSQYLMKEMPQCISEGLKAQGYSGSFKKLKFIGDTYANRDIRNGNSISMHATGRSIDLEKVEITLDNGQPYNVNMTKTSARTNGKSKFYAGVVQCWQRANRARCQGYAHSLTPRSGALDWTFTGSDHTGHVHMSMPFCPHKPGIAQN